MLLMYKLPLTSFCIKGWKDVSSSVQRAAPDRLVKATRNQILFVTPISGVKSAEVATLECIVSELRKATWI